MKRKIIRAGIWSVAIIGSLFLIVGKLQSNKAANAAKAELVQQTHAAVLVKTDTVTAEPLVLHFEANGIFQPNKILDFAAESSGRIASLKADLGSAVRQGQLLAVLDNEQVNNDVELSANNRAKLQSDLARYDSAYKNGGITFQQLQDLRLQATQANTQLDIQQRKLRDSYLKAPISGIIQSKFVEKGGYVSPGTKLFQIVDISTLKLRINVPEYQVVKLRLNDKVPVSSDVFPDKQLFATVRYIAPMGDASLNFPVELELRNIDGNAIRAGMYGRATFRFEENREVMLVPRTAFIGSVNSNEVYVARDGKAVLRKVKAGRILGEQVEVLEGLQAGEQVISSGQINLQDGSSIITQ